MTPVSTSDGAAHTTRSEAFYSPRDLTYIRPRKRRLTEYEAVICHTQPDLGQFDSGGWYLLRPDGLGCQDERTTRLVHPNWFEYRDPSGLWQRPYVKLKAQQERSIAGAIDSAKSNGAFQDIAPEWLDLLSRYYEAFGSFEWGMFRAYAFAVREALSDTLSVAYNFSSMDRLRHQQDIALYSLDLHEQVAGYEEGAGMQTWLNDPVCQPARRLVERILSVRDWGEMVLVTNLVVEPLFTALIGSEFFRRLAPLHGDVVTPVIEMTAEADRQRNRTVALELVRMLTAETDREGRPVPAEDNRQVIREWVRSWYPDTLAAVEAFLPVFDLASARPTLGAEAKARVLGTTQDVLESAGVPLTLEVAS